MAHPHSETTVPSPLLPMLRASVNRDPSAPAVMWDHHRITYGELHDHACGWAQQLTGRGVGPETAVAIALPPSPEALMAWWAVILAGGTVVDIDPGYLPDRVSYTLDRAQVRLGLTSPLHHDALPESVDWIEMTPPILGSPNSAEFNSSPRRTRPIRGANTAHMTQTSARFGMPREVLLTHTLLAAYASALPARFRAGPDSRILHHTNPNHGRRLLESMLTIGAGATAVIAGTDDDSGDALTTLIARHGVTHAVLTPEMLRSIDRQAVPSLQHVIVDGRDLPEDLTAAWIPQTNLIVTWTPSRAPIATTTHTVESGDHRPIIGAPLGDTRVHILDNRLRPVAPGEVGELYLAGTMVARGYGERADVTADRFVAGLVTCPASTNAGAGARMLRTGERARWVDTEAGPALEYVDTDTVAVITRTGDHASTSTRGRV